MSPAPVAADSQQDLQLQTLARAFEALLLTIQQLGCRDHLLQQRLEYASDEYLKLASQSPNGLDTHTKIISEKIRGRYADFDNPSKPPLSPPDVVKALAESGSVGDPTLTSITEGLVCYKSVLHSKGVDRLSDDLNPCIVATRAGVSDSLEKDFTTKGVRGGLRCPFAKPNNINPSENGVSHGIEDPFGAANGDACGHEPDPIKAEQHDRRSSQAPSGSAKSSTTRCPVARCPIRYLDQHSPEEVADYVERHKHEIPRSHAICVQRYQKDSSSMRHLDAKYGSLISMIRGLSVKHQAYLPERTRSEAGNSSSSAERVEKWAEEVGLKPQMHPPIKEEEEEEDGEEERKGHFDRPLREVRLGESPSRPWGIPVPFPDPNLQTSPADADHDSDRSRDHADARTSSAAPLQDHPSTRPAGRCPFGHGAAASAPEKPDDTPVPPLQDIPPHPYPTASKGQCPFGHGAAASASEKPDDRPVTPPQDIPPHPYPTAPKGKCPMGHGAAPSPDQLDPETETIRNQDRAPKPADTVEQETGIPIDGGPDRIGANIIFNGPVFFGFSPEQTASFLQQLGSLGNGRST
ncbi:hypothetical protein P168DRAFT_293489 [Aspergillus campestris IBT 28561]|uniref:Uncharacterized protein n=1 Tax=Aspergillus campestris (strain IBT 28561) TaxID=1392248 RepID=A0A2I1CSQ6_ASPC2|nr:uncharacterized protein P168DRAFT_293489 [Aspergillus campestris IBT 28561]PKY00647.1 hypothetical protein P168DRAFT_293489 [Aspergillus campestris IBT 28561]